MKHINITLFIITLFACNVAFADVAVIVSSGSSVTSLNKNDVKRIFLEKKKKFPGGGKIALIDNKAGSATRDTFYQKVVGKDSAQIKSYWSTMIFSGKGTPPTEVSSDADVITKVAKDSNAIGYVDASAVTGDVKTVFTVK